MMLCCFSIARFCHWEPPYQPKSNIKILLDGYKTIVMLNLFQHPVDKKWLNGWILKQAEGTVRDMCSG